MQPGPPGSIFALKMSETRLSSGRSTGSSPPSDTLGDPSTHRTAAAREGWARCRQLRTELRLIGSFRLRAEPGSNHAARARTHGTAGFVGESGRVVGQS